MKLNQLRTEGGDCLRNSDEDIVLGTVAVLYKRARFYTKLLRQ